ncbi:hypothetical protein DsansV1_C23g0174071 [Dioscorea sansibarensis]
MSSTAVLNRIWSEGIRNANSAKSFCGKSFASGRNFEIIAKAFKIGAGGVTSSAILATQYP